MKILYTLLLVVILVGCSDSFTGYPGKQEVDARVTATSKYRASLVTQPDRSSKGGGKDDGSSSGTSTSSSDQYIVGTATGLDPFAVLERYELQFGVQPKRMFKKNVAGFSVSVANLNATQRAAWQAAMDLDPAVNWYESESKTQLTNSWSRSLREGDQHIPNNIKKAGGRESSVVSGDGTGSVDVDVYVLDSGIDHPDLNVVERIDFTNEGGNLTATGVLERYEVLERFAVLERFEYETGTPIDALGHGTHVAGTIGAIDDTDYLVGVAPGVHVHDFRILDGQGHGEFGAAIEALEIIIARKEANPAKPIVVNMSLGAFVGTTAYNALDYMVQAAVDAGVTVVVAAGNDGGDASLVSPAHVDGAITVGSAYLERNQWNPLASSNVGSQIDIFAQGKNVESLDPSAYWEINRMDGTSMAAPHVAGAVAIYLSGNPDARPSQIRNFLRQSSLKKLKRAPNQTTDLVLDLTLLQDLDSDLGSTVI